MRIGLFIVAVVLAASWAGPAVAGDPSIDSYPAVEETATVSGDTVDSLAASSAVCYTYNPRVTKKNKVGNVLYRMQIDLRWCANGTGIKSASASLPWFPYVASWCCDVVSVSAPVSRWEKYNGKPRGARYIVRQAHVKSCLPGHTYCKHYYPYIKARMLYTGKAVLWRYAG